MEELVVVEEDNRGFNLDQLYLTQRQHFSQSLKELKDLKAQLYSAAQHFEQSYRQHDRKHTSVVNTVKEYATKALVNSVDHLGSLAYKVDALINEKMEDLSSNELRLSSLSQRIRTCRVYANREGNSQLSLSIATPFLHKHYILPEVEGDESRDISASVVGWQSPSVSRQASLPTPPFSFASKSSNGKSGKRSSSPLGFLVRTGSLKDRSTSPIPTASKTRRSPSEPKRPYPTIGRAETDARRGDIQLYTIKNRCLFEALLSIRRSSKK